MCMPVVRLLLCTRTGCIGIKCVRTLSSGKCGLVLGAYTDSEICLTPTGATFDESCAGALSGLLKGTLLDEKKAFVFKNLSKNYDSVAIGGLGCPGLGENHFENLNEAWENIRCAAGIGARALLNQGVSEIYVEDFGYAEAAAEGAILGTFVYDDQKSSNDRMEKAKIKCYMTENETLWKAGIIKGQAQNLSRRLASAPGNLMTPSIFAQAAIENLCPCGVEMEVRTRDWLTVNHFTSFLSIAKGSCENPTLVQVCYNGAPKDVKPIVFVGKGTTFDTGGIMLKVDECRKLKDYRSNMAGAAAIVGLFQAVARLSLPVNIVGLMPLFENAVSGGAVKYGDVVFSMNNKAIRIDHTDNEGRVAMADALVYSKEFKPCMTMTVGNLTEALHKGIGELPTGVFTNHEEVWHEFCRAGLESGDRFWRFPIWKDFRTRVTNITSVDISNEAANEGGDPCLAAAFLSEFAPQDADFIHIEISGTGRKVNTTMAPYMQKGTMSGRPVRGLTQLLYNMSCPNVKNY